MDDRNDTIERAIRYIEKVSDMTHTPEKQDLLIALKALEMKKGEECSIDDLCAAIMRKE